MIITLRGTNKIQQLAQRSCRYDHHKVTASRSKIKINRDYKNNVYKIIAKKYFVYQTLILYISSTPFPIIYLH